MAEGSAGGAGYPETARCKGKCGQEKPVSGLGSDGRCLDCRLHPTASYVPPLSSTQRRKRSGLPRWGGPRQEEDW